MGTADFIALIHPAIAVTVVFPIIGMVVNFAWQTRQRRLQNLGGGKSKIPPVVGREHVKLGKWLSGSVVGITIIALAYSVVFGSKGFIDQQKSGELQIVQVVLIALMFVVTIAAFVLLYRARQPLWRGVFATLTGIGLVVLGSQDGVYRRTFEWYSSHYYMGIAAALLMVFSLAIIEDIYKDRSNRWRNIHIILNCLALLLFLGQGMTGARDLLEIPLSWQKPFLYQCDFENLNC